MQLGMPYAEYVTRVGPENRTYHESAEAMILAKQGVLPLEPEEDDGGEQPDDDPLGDTKMRRARR